MGLLERLNSLLDRDLEALVSASPDPARKVGELIVEVEGLLAELQREAAYCLRARRILLQEIEREKGDLALYVRRAELAVKRDREDLARRALLRKRERSLKLERRQGDLEANLARHDLLRERRDKVQQLAARLRDHRRGLMGEGSISPPGGVSSNWAATDADSGLYPCRLLDRTEQAFLQLGREAHLEEEIQAIKEKLGKKNLPGLRPQPDAPLP